MNEILDEKKALLKKSFKKYKITPFWVIGLFLTLISIAAFIFGLFNELTGKGSKGTMTVIILAVLVFGGTQLVLFLERLFVTEENKRQIIIGEVIIIVVIWMRLYSLSYSH